MAGVATCIAAGDLTVTVVTRSEKVKQPERIPVGHPVSDD
jgi:hypothetical protein